MGEKIKFKCGCGKLLVAPLEMTGRRVKCPNCTKTLQIPRPAHPEEELEVLPVVAGFNWQEQPGPAVAPQTARPKSPAANRNHAPLADQQRSNPTRPASPPRVTGAGNFGPPPLPAKSPAAPNAFDASIWEEVEADNIRQQAAAAIRPLCPNCGLAMSHDEIVCLACGCNRRTGAVPTLQPIGPKPKQQVDVFGWIRRKNRHGRRGGILGERLTLGLLVFGVVFTVMGFQEMSLSSASSADPETMSLRKLIERGASGNPNLLLTNYLICDDIVVEHPQLRDTWNKVWVPIVPFETIDGQRPDLANIKNPQAIIYSEHVHDEHELVAKLQVQQLRGMVTNRITSLASKDKDLLRTRYPNVDFDRCLIFHEGREPKDSSTIMLFLITGLAAAAAGGISVLSRIV